VFLAFSEMLFNFSWVVYFLASAFMCYRITVDAPYQRLFKVIKPVGDWCEQRALNKLHFHTRLPDTELGQM
jgi:hypothetical protein